jgi:hypothetical protein
LKEAVVALAHGSRLRATLDLPREGVHRGGLMAELVAFAGGLALG